MSVFKNCVNCGAQNLIDEEYKPSDKCIRCSKPIGVNVVEKEVPVPAAINVEDLPKDVKEKVIEKATGELPPVPPKPDTNGMTTIKKNQALHDYYAANKEPILQYYDVLGEPAMLKAWGMSYATWYLLRYRWRPVNFPKPKIYKRKKKEATTSLKPEKKPKVAHKVPEAIIRDIDQADEVCNGCPVLQAFKGYKLAVKDILSIKKL